MHVIVAKFGGICVRILKPHVLTDVQISVLYRLPCMNNLVPEAGIQGMNK